MDQKEIQELVFIVTIIVLVLAITLIVFFFYFQQKKTAYLIKQREIQKRYEEEISKSRLEIHEQALQNISWEIHDNVGQLLSVAKIQINMLQLAVDGPQKEKINETGAVISKSLQELRDLAKSLNPDTIKNMGLIDSIQHDVDRFNRLKVLNASLNISGDPYDLPPEKEIILFRILQEFSNNTLKHAKANELLISMNYRKNALEIVAKDNGYGFDSSSEQQRNGIGLINMKSRAALINASFNLNSVIKQGTKLYLSCPK